MKIFPTSLMFSFIRSVGYYTSSKGFGKTAMDENLKLLFSSSDDTRFSDLAINNDDAYYRAVSEFVHSICLKFYFNEGKFLPEEYLTSTQGDRYDVIVHSSPVTKGGHIYLHITDAHVVSIPAFDCKGTLSIPTSAERFLDLVFGSLVAEGEVSESYLKALDATSYFFTVSHQENDAFTWVNVGSKNGPILVAKPKF